MGAEDEGVRRVSLTEALEDYCGTHPESLEVLLRWPARRFDHFYTLHQRRKILAGLEEQKNVMVAALWSNPNWDDNKGTRSNAIEKIEAQYEEAVYKIQNYGIEEDGEEIDKENPFFAASERGLKKLFGEYEGDLPKAPKPEEEAEWTKDIDQG